jgi:hypothetical protein
MQEEVLDDDDTFEGEHPEPREDEEVIDDESCSATTSEEEEPQTPMEWANYDHGKIEERTKEICEVERTILSVAYQAGQCLREALKDIPHGGRQKYIEENFVGSYPTARQYIRIANHWGMVHDHGSIRAAMEEIWKYEEKIRKRKKEAEAERMAEELRQKRLEEDEDEEPVDTSLTKPPTVDADEIRMVWYEPTPAEPKEPKDIKVAPWKNAPKKFRFTASGKSLIAAAKKKMIAQATEVIEGLPSNIILFLGADAVKNDLWITHLGSVNHKYDDLARAVIGFVTKRQLDLEHVGKTQNEDGDWVEDPKVSPEECEARVVGIQEDYQVRVEAYLTTITDEKMKHLLKRILL